MLFGLKAVNCAPYGVLQLHNLKILKRLMTSAVSNHYSNKNKGEHLFIIIIRIRIISPFEQKLRIWGKSLRLHIELNN